MAPKLPPHSVEAERSVLGSALLSQNALLDLVEQLSEEDFYRKEHQKIFKAILKLFERKSTVDLITLKDELERQGVLDEIGGAEYLTSLVDAVISPSLAREHSELVQEKAVFRKVIDAAGEILAEAYRGEKNANELLDWAEQAILEIRQKRLKWGFRRLGEISQEVLSQIDDIRSGKSLPGTPTGFKDLDQIIAGLADGNMVILASRPSVGKTSFMLNIHHRLSVGKKVPSAIFSLEMSPEELTKRFLAMQSRVDGRKIGTATLSKEEMRKLVQAVSDLKDAPVFIDSTPAIPLSEIRAKARRIVREEGVKLISIDYMQLVKSPRSDTRQQEVSAISQGLKALARELNIPVLALSQLSRSPEQREDKTPRLSDLRESGAIEQDADVVIFLHRPELYGESPMTRNRVEVIVAKNRNGPTGKIELTFLKQFTSFEDMAQDDVLQAEEFGDDLAF